MATQEKNERNEYYGTMSEDRRVRLLHYLLELSEYLRKGGIAIADQRGTSQRSSRSSSSLRAFERKPRVKDLGLLEDKTRERTTLATKVIKRLTAC